MNKYILARLNKRIALVNSILVDVGVEIDKTNNCDEMLKTNIEAQLKNSLLIAEYLEKKLGEDDE